VLAPISAVSRSYGIRDWSDLLDRSFDPIVNNSFDGLPEKLKCSVVASDHKKVSSLFSHGVQDVRGNIVHKSG
jgi:hypothetical protein